MFFKLNLSRTSSVESNASTNSNASETRESWPSMVKLKLQRTASLESNSSFSSVKTADFEAVQSWESIPDKYFTKAFGGMRNFMLSHGIRRDARGHEEARELLNMFKQEAWESGEYQRRRGKPW
ncbi:hypothetical protein BKA69DRAFT_1083933 [Paraphysoderma sedebokerense]|nr:hypothetical protein BKA69DRAFT_1083933 [Paraphysoderma sedebokerense]